MQGSCNWKPPGWGWIYVLHFQSSLPSMVRAWEGSWDLSSSSTGAAPAPWPYKGPLKAWFQSFIATNSQHTTPGVGNSLHVWKGNSLTWPVMDSILISSTPSWWFQQFHVTLHRRSDRFCTWPTNSPVQGGGNWGSAVGLALLQRGAAQRQSFRHVESFRERQVQISSEL